MARISDEDLKALKPWSVRRNPRPTVEEVAQLRTVIEGSTDERAIQRHLTAHRHLWSPLLGGGHGRWVRPKIKLGDRYEADFMIADGDSAGIHWVFVELESPTAPMFTRAGQFADKTRTAIFQIQSWRTYIEQNVDMARRPRHRGGLGLPHIASTDMGLVLVGRRDETSQDIAELRRHTETNDRIHVRSYDWLLDQLEAVASETGWDHLPGGAFPRSAPAETG